MYAENMLERKLRGQWSVGEEHKGTRAPQKEKNIKEPENLREKNIKEPENLKKKIT